MSLFTNIFIILVTPITLISIELTKWGIKKYKKRKYKKVYTINKDNLEKQFEGIKNLINDSTKFTMQDRHEGLGHWNREVGEFIYFL